MININRISLVKLVFILLVFSTSCNNQGKSDVNLVKNFKLKSLSHEKIYTFDDLKGTPIVLNFWASWCVPCREEMPFLENNWKEYKDKGVKFIGINVMDDKAEALKTVDEFGISYLNLFDHDGGVSRLYDVLALPVTFFIDKNGKAIHKNYGPYLKKSGEEKFRGNISKILDEYANN